MTLQKDKALATVPQWRKVYCEYLQRDILVRRPNIGDMAFAVADMWIRLVRDGDNTPLFDASIKPSECDPKLVGEVCSLATATPTEATDLTV
jgi:hypothetical protein